jgi:hypothetical protein
LISAAEAITGSKSANTIQTIIFILALLLSTGGLRGGPVIGHPNFTFLLMPGELAYAAARPWTREQLAKHIRDDSILGFLIGYNPAGLFTQSVNEFS